MILTFVSRPTSWAMLKALRDETPRPTPDRVGDNDDGGTYINFDAEPDVETEEFEPPSPLESKSARALVSTAMLVQAISAMYGVCGGTYRSCAEDCQPWTSQDGYSYSCVDPAEPECRSRWDACTEQDGFVGAAFAGCWLCACGVAAPIYLVLALANFPAGREGSRYAVMTVALGTALSMLLGFLLNVDVDNPIVDIFGLPLFCLVAGGSVPRALSRCSACPTTVMNRLNQVGAVVALAIGVGGNWLSWYLHGSIRYMLYWRPDSDSKFKARNIYMPITACWLAALAAMAAYMLLELGSAGVVRVCCCCGCRCCRRKEKKAPTTLLDLELVGVATSEASVEDPKARRNRRVMAGAMLAGLGCGYLIIFTSTGFANEADVLHIKHGDASLTNWMIVIFAMGPFFSVPFVLGFAATAQMVLEVCSVEGSVDTSRWLAFTLTMLSFGERKRKGRTGQITRCFGNPNLSEFHGMLCGCVYSLGGRANLVRWFVDKTIPFTIWSQAVSSKRAER